MKLHLKLSLLSVITLCSFQSCAERILFYFGSSIYSHKLAVWPLVHKLAERGHKITFLSPPDPAVTLTRPAHPNVVEFSPKSLIIYWKEKESNNKTRDVIASRIKGFSDGQSYWESSLQAGLETCRVIFRSLEVQVWVSKSQFDLIVIDTPYNECALALAFSMGAPYILFGTQYMYMWQQEMFGLPDEASWLPNFYNHFSTEMSFFQRVRNALTPIQWSYATNRVSYILPQMEKLMQKSLNLSELPNLDELEKGTSLFLLNTHFIQEYPRSLPPFVVPVGGMHCFNENRPQELINEELQSFLDSQASKGLIYFSLGSRVDFSKAPSVVVQKFLQVFTTLELPVVWRWGDLEGSPDNVPSNVFLAKWVPQTTILSNSHLKIFITHAGMLSYQEAIFHAVPIIAFPLSPEEDYNAAIIERSAGGIKLDITFFTQYDLATSVRKILNDETFKVNMLRISSLFKDRPQKPVETAVWWTEYVMRYKNLSFTKPLAINQSWYQRRLLDVWAFLAFVTIGSVVVLYTSLNYLLCMKATPVQRHSKHKHKTS